MAEFLGTFVLILFGDGVVAMTVLFGTGVPGEIVKGGYTNITIGWGLAVTMGVYLAGRISGAHLNPAVSVALAVYRDFPWRKVAPYIGAQTWAPSSPPRSSIGITCRRFRRSIPVSRKRPGSSPLSRHFRRCRSRGCWIRPLAPHCS